MPIYEYRCSKCEKTFEIFQKISEEPLSECPDCGGRINRLISRTNFSLRGGGWYKDGYSSAEDGTKTKKEKETATESKPSDTKKDSDSKPPEKKKKEKSSDKK